MAAVMLCLRNNLQRPDRAFQCSPSFFPSTCVLAASLPDADRALPFLSSSSSISCHLPCPPSCRHLAEHQRRPPTFPVLSFFPFSLSAHRHHPSSPALPLFSASSPHPTALSPPRHRRLSPPSLPLLHRRLLPPSWSIPLPPPLSLLCCSSFASPTSFCGLSRRPQEPPWLRSSSPSTPHLRSSVPSLFSPSASAPSSLIDAAAVASFTAAFLIPPPLMSSPPPYSPSLPCLPTSDPRGSSSASAAAPSRLRLRPLLQPWTRAGDGHRLGEDVGVSLILFSFWAGNGLKLYLVGWVGLAYWAKYGLGWPVG